MSHISPKAIDTSDVRKWKRYPAYKESGVEWLGEIPAHWEVKRLKWVVSQIGSGKTPKGGSEIYSDSGIVFLRSQNIHFDGLRLDDVVYIAQSIDAEMASTRVLPQDVLLNITGASLGRCSIITENFPAANVNQHVCIIRSVKSLIEPGFLYNAIASDAVQAQIFSSENGVSREGLTFSQVANIVLPIPRHLSEQQAIASYLDRETTKLDPLITNKKQLIQLLQEKRTALISHAVTKGLNPDVPLKDSGFEWLGEIPAHWQVKRLKYGYEICLGKMLQNQPESPLDTLEPYLRSANVLWEGVNISDVKEMWFSPYEKSLYELKPGDLVINEGGDVGRSAIWKGELPKCYIQNAVHRVRNKKGYSNNFLYYWLFWIKAAGYIDLLCNKATIAHFTVEKVREIPVTYSEFEEQEAIASYLDRETTKLDALITKTHTSIEQLKEYRTALISAAVTGKIKIDVPEVAHAS